MKLVFVTGNEGKVKEVQAILGFPIEIAKIELDEVQSLDIEYITKKKALHAFTEIQKPLIVEDAGLYIEAWKGIPGPFIKHIDSAGGNELLLKMLRNETNRKVYFKSAIGYHDGQNIHIFTGEVHGQIAEIQKGKLGWGHDPIFIPEGHTQTFGEMTNDEKNRISHRREALKKLKEFLKQSSSSER